MAGLLAASMGSEIFDRLGQIKRVGNRRLLEGLEIALRSQIPQVRGVHRRRPPRDGSSAGTSGPALRGDQIFESNDLEEAETSETAENFQTAGKELSESEPDEHKCRDLGTTFEAVFAVDSELTSHFRKSFK